MLKLKKILALSLIPQYLLIQLISFYPSLIESVYSNHIYLFLSTFFRTASSNIPFAMGDVLYIIVGIFSIYWVIINFKKPSNEIYENNGVDVMNEEMEREIKKSPTEYSWEYKKFRKLSQESKSIYKS